MIIIFFFVVHKQLTAFGVSKKAIKRATKNKGSPITANKIYLDEEHPPAEALGYALSRVKQYTTNDAWRKITVASMYMVSI